MRGAVISCHLGTSVCLGPGSPGGGRAVSVRPGAQYLLFPTAAGAGGRAQRPGASSQGGRDPVPRTRQDLGLHAFPEAKAAVCVSGLLPPQLSFYSCISKQSSF